MSISDEYLAGLIDGDGYMQIVWSSAGKPRPRYILGISLRENEYTNALLNTVKLFYGGTVISQDRTRHIISDDTEYLQRMIHWTVKNQKGIYDVLTRVSQYLWIKCEEAELMIDALEYSFKKLNLYWGKEDCLYIAEIADKIASNHTRKHKRLWDKNAIEKAFLRGL